MKFDAKGLSVVETAQAALALCPHQQLKTALIITAEKVVGAFAMHESMLYIIPESEKAKLLCDLVGMTILDAINEAAMKDIARNQQPAPSAEAITAAEKLTAEIIAQAARPDSAPKL